jgi:hypothetical protein
MYQSLPFRSSALALAVALTAGCSDNGSSSNNIVVDNLPVIDEAPAPQYRMSANGGDGYEGGEGGRIAIVKTNSSAKVLMSNSGEVTLTPEIPSLAADLGETALTITADTEITYLSTETPAAGSVYVDYRDDAQRVFSFDGATESEVTGLEVAAGATLTLNASEGTIAFENDVVIKGTLLTTDSYLDFEANAVFNEGRIEAPNRDLSINALLISNSGVIDLDGDETRNGGDAELYALAIHNTGSITANGGSGAFTEIPGVYSYASGGDIDLNAALAILNEGTISANAGYAEGYEDSTDAGDISLISGYITANTGTLTANGNDSDNGESDGGEIALVVEPQRIEEPYPEEDMLRVAAVDAELAIPEGFDPSNYSPMLINTGSISANGGNSIDADYDAGDGGYIAIVAVEFDVPAEESEEYEAFFANGVQVTISGDLSVNGGSVNEVSSSEEGYGGDAGQIVIAHINEGEDSPASMSLLGYESVSATGGTGSVYAGGGGYFGISDVLESAIMRLAVAEEPVEEAYAAPSIELTTDVDVSSGTLVEGADSYASSDSGGYIMLGHWSREFANSAATVSIEANLVADSSDVTSGAEDISADNDGDNGVAIRAFGNLSINGSISANGASATSTALEAYNVEGGEGGNVYFSSVNGSVNSSASVNVNGGSGSTEGGNGGGVEIYSEESSVSFSGALSMNGGNADATIEESTGGNGGEFYSYSGADLYTLPTTYSFTGGTGADAGLLGSIYQDETCVDGQCLLVTEEMMDR